MLLNDRMLVLRGWRDDSRSLRVEVKSSDLHIVSTCTIYKIEDELIAFHIADHDYFEMSLADCTISFGDAKDSANEMPIGRISESAFMATRDGFHAIIVLLQD